MHPLFGSSAVPRYAQLAELFRRRIARGQWEPGARLPSLEALMREFDVARVTVRQAMELLARDGLVLPQRGRGTFVSAAPRRERSIRLQTRLRELAEVYREDKPRLTLIEDVVRSPYLRAEDGGPAPRYHYLRRVHSREGEAYCVISIYLDERVFKRAASRFRRETVIPVLLDLKVRLGRARQTLKISTADVETASLLEVALNSPTAEVRRVFTAPDGTVLYVGEVTYRGDYVHLEMDLQP